MAQTAKTVATGNPLFILAKQALFTFCISLILVGPISGLVLDGFSFDNELGRAVSTAAVITAGRVALSLLAMTSLGRRISGSLARNGAGVTVRTGQQRSAVPVLALIFVAGLCLPFFADKYYLGVAILALIYCLLGLGLNIVVGLAGLLDLGFVAFYAVGAYLMALGSQYLGLGFWSALVIAPFLAALFGMVLAFPVLKMHGDYLAIVTLGFGEIIRLVLNNWLDFTGGPNGAAVPAPTLFGLEFTRSARQGGTPFHEFFGISYNATTSSGSSISCSSSSSAASSMPCSACASCRSAACGKHCAKMRLPAGLSASITSSSSSPPSCSAHRPVVWRGYSSPSIRAS